MMKLFSLLCIVCLLGCGGSDTASRPDSYPSAPKADSVSLDSEGGKPGGNASLNAVP